MADDRAAESAEVHIEELQTALDEARREKKAFFANLFVDACRALSTRLKEGDGGAPMADEWWRVCTGRICAIGRKYATELSVETVEDIVEGEGVEPAVIEVVFGPLRQLHAYSE